MPGKHVPTIKAIAALLPLALVTSACMQMGANGDGQGFEGGGHLEERLAAAQTRLRAAYHALPSEADPATVCTNQCADGAPGCSDMKALTDAERTSARDFLLSNAAALESATAVVPKVVLTPLTIKDPAGKVVAVDARANADQQKIEVYAGFNGNEVALLGHENGHLIAKLGGATIVDYQTFQIFTQVNGGGRMLNAAGACMAQYEARVSLAPGSYDPAFNGDGKVDFMVGGDKPSAAGPMEVHAVATQPDGKILVAGGYNVDSTVNSPNLARRSWFVLRLLRDGRADTTFYGINGVRPFLFVRSFGYNVARSLTVLPDGKIFVVGSVSDFNNGASIGVVRLNPDGSLDTSFAPQAGGLPGSAGYNEPGTAIYNGAGWGIGHRFLPADFGSTVVLVGVTGYIFLGPTYQPIGGATLFPSSTFAVAMAPFGPSSFLVSQQVSLRLEDIPGAGGIGMNVGDPGPSVLLNASVTTSGTLGYWLGSSQRHAYIARGDSTQPRGLAIGIGGANEQEFLPMGPTASMASKAVLQSDGKLVVAGTYVKNGATQTFVSRHGNDLALDATYGNRGVVTLALPSTSCPPVVGLDAQGAAIVAGCTANGQGFVQRLRP